MKKVFSLFLMFIMLSRLFPVYAQSKNSIPLLTKPSEDYLAYQNLCEEEKNNILSPLPFKIESTFYAQTTPYLLGTSTLPSIYDLREEHVLTPVKNQGSSSVCWSFSGLALLESQLMKKTGKIYDFSEKHAAYYMSSSSFKDGTNEYGWDRAANSSGNAYHMASYLYSGFGPTEETYMPYGLLTDEIYLSDIYDKPRSNVRLNDMGFLTSKVNMASNPLEIENFKNVLYSYGPLSTGIYLNTSLSSTYHNTTYNSFYNPNATTPNHAVTIVGWDDDFGKENFSTVPEGDGAWIVRNSWGDSVMEEGYFYLSYYQTLFDTSFFYDVQDELGYDNIYSVKQNNYAGTIDGSVGIEYAANVFTKTQGTQKLSEIVIMASEQTTYEVYVNPNPQGDDIFPETIEDNCLAKGTIEYAGYKTIKLDSPVFLTNDEFAVIVKYSGSSVPITNMTYSEGIGLLSFDGDEWIDLVGTETDDFTYDCVILAYTTDEDEKTDVTFSKSPAHAQITLMQDEKEIKPKQGGIYSLLPGTYKYKAIADGYLDTPTYTFNISEVDLGKEKTIKIKQNIYDVNINVLSETIEISVTSMQTADETDKLIIAHYDKNGRLFSSEIIEVSDLTQKLDNVYSYETTKKPSQGDKIKVYIWNDMQNMSSLSYTEEYIKE